MILVLCIPIALAGCDLFKSDPKVTAISLKETFKTTYNMGDTLNTSGSTMTATRVVA